MATLRIEISHPGRVRLLKHADYYFLLWGDAHVRPGDVILANLPDVPPGDWEAKRIGSDGNVKQRWLNGTSC